MTKNKVTLESLFNIGSSKRVLKSQWTTEGVPFYRGREITSLAKDGYVDNELFISENLYSNYAKKYGVPKTGDIVITAIGTIGNSYIVQDHDKFYFKDASVLWLNRKVDVSSEYINLWLKSPLFIEQLDKGNGATVDTLTIKKLQSVTVNLPSISEQQRIVAILDQAFEGIAKARANAEQNLQNARALFESHLQSVFSVRGELVELRHPSTSSPRTGEGWIEKTLSEVCEIKPSKSEAKKLLRNSDLVSFAPMEDLGINQKYLNPSKQRTLEDVAGSYTYFAEGDVLLAKITPCFENGKLGIAKNLTNGIGFGSSEYIVFRPKKELSNEFLYYFLSRKHFIEEGAQRMSGAVGHKRVSKEFIENYKISFPLLELQMEIVRKIDALSKETQRLEALYQRKIELLDELKKSLLQQAFAGEL